MIELIILVVVLVWAVTMVQKKKGPAPAPTAGQQAQPKTGTPAPVAAPRLVKTLDIDGTNRFSGSALFVKQFGLAPQQVNDICYVNGPLGKDELSPRARSCLELVFAEGRHRGAEVVQMLFENRPLSPAEALFFVLVTPPGAPKSYIAGFVHKAVTPVTPPART